MGTTAKSKTRRASRYADCTGETQAFMSAVESHLKDKFGGINAEWEGLLSILSAQYDLYIRCAESIKADGLMVQNRFGGTDRNPLIKVQTDAIIQIKSIAQEFGLSPRSLKRLQLTENNEDEFIESLTND